MEHRYKQLITPISLGNHILKNRMICAKCVPNYLQGPQNFPTETTVRFVSDLARNGASIVTCTIGTYPELQALGTRHSSLIDMTDRANHREYRRMIDRIHAYGTLASAPTNGFIPENLAISHIHDKRMAPRIGFDPFAPREPQPEMTQDDIHRFIDQFTAHCRLVQAIGFDMINIHMSYGNTLLAKTLSPLHNQREDEYGGSLENRARMVMELMESVKAACGTDFLIELQLSGCEDDPRGYSVTDFVAFCQLFDRYADILQLRASTVDLAHVNSYISSKEEPSTIEYARVLKAAGLKHALVAPVGGFQDPDIMERHLREGSADLIALARAFICDDHFGQRILEQRGEDIVPCLRCDRCHQAYCTTNPKVSIASYWDNMFQATPRQKKIAVVGGGPAGMTAAVAAAERGHHVTLYEAADTLGGQLLHADYLPREKWALLDLKNYMIRKVEQNQNVQVLLSTKATPELLSRENFDAVIAACGSVPKPSPISLPQNITALAPISVFGHEQELGHHVVVVGGSMTAVDTALYLCNTGHKVTMITRKNRPGYDCSSHSAMYISQQLMNRFDVVTDAEIQAVQTGEIICVVQKKPQPGPPGMEQSPIAPPKEVRVPFDSLVFSAGRKACTDACMEFSSVAPEFRVIGDASILSDKNNGDGHGEIPQSDGTVHGDLRNCFFTAYTAANAL